MCGCRRSRASTRRKAPRRGVSGALMLPNSDGDTCCMTPIKDHGDASRSLTIAAHDHVLGRRQGTNSARSVSSRRFSRTGCWREMALSEFLRSHSLGKNRPRKKFFFGRRKTRNHPRRLGAERTATRRTDVPAGNSAITSRAVTPVSAHPIDRHKRFAKDSLRRQLISIRCRP